MPIPIKFDFEIKYIKGKENRVVDALNERIQLNHLAAISYYGVDLVEQMNHARQHEKKYHQIKERIQQGSEDGKDEEYHLTDDGLVRFNNRIYVPNNEEMKRLILRESSILIHISVTRDTRRL